MISDHFNGFSDFDFKRLLEKGDIEITSGQHTKKQQLPIEGRTAITNVSLESVALKKALPPIIDKSTEYLILGTMPGEKSLVHQEYYNNPRNQFWNIISDLFKNGKPFTNYNDKLDFLKKHKIGLWDVLDTCDREGSLDSRIKNITVNNFEKLFYEYPNIKVVIFNGQDSCNYFSTYIKNKSGKKTFIQLTSTSSTNTHKTLDEKTKEWQAALRKNSR